MAVNGAQAASLYRELSSEASQLIRRYEALKASMTQQQEAVTAALEAARGELAAVYLPRLERAALQSAEQLTGFRGFSRRDPLQAMAQERRRLQGLVQKIAASEPYQRRKQLVGEYGEFTRALTEAEDMLAPWERECARFEDLRDFVTLYELGYDTPQYAVRWWDPAYWRYWASGDAVCEALEMDDFGRRRPARL